MRELTCDVAIVGAGTAGLHAYKAATAAGAAAVIVEKGPGGSTCTRVGCMPSKLLIAAARAAHHARGAGRFGIRVDGVAVDGAAVLARVRQERDRFERSVLDTFHAIPAERRLHGEARFAGPTTLLVGEEARIAARAVIVATGAHPTVPEGIGGAGDLVRTHETIFEIEALPRAMAVIGAGPLGLELAQAFARLGTAVTLLDGGDAVGKLTDPEAARAARDALAGEFAIHLGVEVTARREGAAAVVRWTGASAGEARVDLVLAAAGRPPTLQPIDFAAAGVPLDDKGVPRFAAATRRVGDTPVFVAGDVDAWRPVLHEAARGGRIAGTVAAGGGPAKPLPALAIAFTEPNLVEVGCGFNALPEGARTATVPLCDDARAQIDGEAEGVVRLYADAERRLIGGTLVAHGGEHLGHLVALAIERGTTAADFADQPWYHPTVEEALQAAARQLDAD